MLNDFYYQTHYFLNMIYNLKYKKLTYNGNIEYEYPDRSKGLWIYSLHPKFTDKNHNIWDAVDTSNNVLNKTLQKYDIPYNIWGSDIQELYDELEVSEYKKQSLFVVVYNDKIIGKNDSLSTVEEWIISIIDKILNSKDKVIQIKQVQEIPKKEKPQSLIEKLLGK